MESEFFGYEKGAFTGAAARTLGLLEFADGGTVFLDEIAELPPLLQAKLLRALQERSIRRVGGRTEIDVDIRIVAATSRNLAKDVEERRFRDDLFYRINVVSIDLPPLRERGRDIGILAEHFVQQFAGSMSRHATKFDQDALDILQGYAWPGNVRELQNVVRRALVACRDSVIGVDALPEEIVTKAATGDGSGGSAFFTLREKKTNAFEKEYLTALLQQNQGEVTVAAVEAGIPRGTFYRLMQKHDIDPDDFRP